MNQIVPMILDRIRSELVMRYQEVVDPQSAVYPHEIKLGIWQDDPKRKNVYIALIGGKRSNPELQDGISSLKDIDNVSYEPPVREIGGGTTWVRRMTASIGCYFILERLEEVEALNRAYEVLGRVCSIIDGTQISDLVDDFGECGIQLFTAGSSYFVSGGPSQYIWRGEVMIYAYTERT